MALTIQEASSSAIVTDTAVFTAGGNRILEGLSWYNSHTDVVDLTVKFARTATVTIFKITVAAGESGHLDCSKSKHYFSNLQTITATDSVGSKIHMAISALGVP